MPGRPGTGDVALVLMDRVAVAPDDAVAATAAEEARAIWRRLGAHAGLARVDELLSRRGSTDGQGRTAEVATGPRVGV